MRPLRRGQVPLWVVMCLAVVLVIVLAWWTFHSTSDAAAADGRETIVFWGHVNLGEDVEILLHRFEQKFPQ